MKRPKKTDPFDLKTFLANAGEGRTISESQENQVIYQQGDSADSVFCIRTGKAKLAVLSAQGKEAVVGLLGPGDFFGEGCLAGQPQRLATASALTDCTIVRMAKADIVRLIHEQPAFSELFISYLLSRNTRIEEDLVDQLFNSSEKRLAAGGKINLPWGDSFGVNAVYSEGAVGYATKAGNWQLYNGAGTGASVGVGWLSDGIFETGGQVQLTRAWSINAAYERVWNRQWRQPVRRLCAGLL